MEAVPGKENDGGGIMEFIQFAAKFLFWLFLAIVFGSLCWVGLFTIGALIRGMHKAPKFQDREHNDHA
jgi:hypothetical protein